MGGQDNRHTLQGLAQRLETLERENAELRQEVSALRGSGARRDEVVALRGSEEHRDQEEPVSEFEGRVSRRSLLSKAGAAAVVAVAAGTLVNPREAKAHHYGGPIEAGHVFTHGVTAEASRVDEYAIRGAATSATWAAIHAQNSGSGAGVRALGGTGVWGSSATSGHSGVYGQHTGTSGFGVVGDGKGGDAGVLGRSSSDVGVQGEGLVGVLGQTTGSTFGHGVEGVGKGSGSGVVGRNPDSDGVGVDGRGDTGVWGLSSRTGYSGVYGQHRGSSGYGVVGDGMGGSAGVLGRNPSGEGVRGAGRTGLSGVGSDDQQAGVKGEGPTGVWGLSSKTSYSGVYGEHTGTSGIGTTGIGKGGAPGVLGRNNTGVGVLGEGRNGVHGTANGGYGGQFEGGRAQLRLVPAGSAGKPTSGTHQKGEIYMDSAGALFVCTATSTATTAAKWRKVTTTAV
jgi:hypothetical protein